VDELLAEARRLGQPRENPDPMTLQEQLRSWQNGDGIARERRLETVDAALAQVRRELQQTVAVIQRIETETAAAYAELKRADLPRLTRESRVLELESSHRNKVQIHEERRRLLEAEVARIQAMKDRLSQ
jgi:hypothetical protein